MSLTEECETLRCIPMFARMDPARLKLLSFTSERVCFMAGESFIRQGEVGNDAYVIVTGEAEVLAETGDGLVKLGEIGANHLVGEIALLHSGTRTATVRAKTPLTCLRLSKDVFFHLLRELPDFALAVMRDLAARLDQRTAQFRQALSAAPQTH